MKCQLQYAGFKFIYSFFKEKCMTKAELIALNAEKAFSATFEVIAKKMAEKIKVLVPGFGGFSTKDRAEREGRNPKTGDKIKIPAATIASFKPATQLKETINN